MSENSNTISKELSDALDKGLRIIIPDDELSAIIIFQIPHDLLQQADREHLRKYILLKMRQHRVSYGLDVSFLEGKLDTDNPYVVATAKIPIHGKDAEITMFEIPEANPEVQQDGSTNFYNINLMQSIQEGDWLGEKKPPTLGIAGVNVRGKIINATDGIDAPLVYDKDSVTEEEENGIVVLRAMRSGMLQEINGRLGVVSHLEFENIDFSTGNIDFDGSLTIRGTIMDGFTVRATGDISVLGE
ncbi:MAG: FapA family protein, partial [Symbiobacteriaceae bacterium]|nr:FapA family protein [Symbiobacteriaceae bacterium]